VKLGGHMSTAGGIVNGLDRGAEIGCEAIQIYAQSPRMWRPYNHNDEALDSYAALEAASTVEATYCHAPFLINLATDNEALAAQSLECLVHNLVIGTRIGAQGVVLHVGSHKGSGFDGVVKGVSALLSRALETAAATAGRDSCMLLLENCAGTGGVIGRTFDELGRLIDACGGDERLGVCIDTQHLFASGVPFSNREESDAAISTFDETVGLERLRLIHLNDSKVPFGSNRDRHENLGDGEIGKRALGWFLSHPALASVPAVLEVPGAGDGPRASDMATARSILKSGLKARG
jgi:deoxyribonuclease-4